METWLVISLAFLGAFLAVIAANAVLVELASGERRRINQEVQETLRQRVKLQIRVKDLEDVVLRTAAAPSKLRDRLASVIEQAGMEFTVKQLIGSSVAAAVGFFVVLVAIFQLSMPLDRALLLAMPGLAAGVAPLLYVLHARKKRQDKLLSQLPDAFELMSRVLRAGQTINYAMQIVADQGSPPLSLEFLRCNEQMNLGMTPEAALHELAHRTGLLEMRIFTVAILVQRQTGGNLSVLFDKMGGVVRERYRIGGMIKALTAQGRMQAVILSGLPVAMFALLMYTQPTYEGELLNYPLLSLTALGMLVVGSLWIRRVVNFDY
jgi:tight adherence protein B